MSTWRAVRVMWRAEFSAAAAYRADLLTALVTQTAWLGFTIAPVLVVFDHVDDAQGWTLGRLLVLQAVWFVLDAVVWMFLIPNLARLSERVRSGQLDMLLLRPVDSLVMSSLGGMVPHDSVKLLAAGVLATVAVVFGDSPASLGHVAAGLVAVVAGTVVLWSIGVLTHVWALTNVRFEAGFAMHGVHNLARVPTPFYGTALRFVLTVVVPVAFVTTVPTQLMFGDVAFWWLGAAVAMAVLGVVVSRWAWNSQIRRYVGALS